MTKVIDIKNLTKTFGDVKAVNDISFCVKEGELFAFLGENGAGKSTTISIISGTLKKDQGKVIVCDKDLDEYENAGKDIGIVFQTSVLDKNLSARENLKYRAGLYGIFGKEFEAKYNELASLFKFTDYQNRPLSKLSGGQKRRIDIARALIHSPKILILDEPTTGLDPQTRNTVWKVINTLRETTGITVFLTTHYMEETSDADYIIILDKGKIVAEGTPLELKNAYAGDFLTIYNVGEEVVKKLNKPYKKIKDAFRIELKDTAEATKLIQENPQIFTDYEITKGKIDDVFLAVTGKDLKVEE